MNLDQWRARRVIKAGTYYGQAIMALIYRDVSDPQFDFPPIAHKLPSDLLFTDPQPDWVVEAGELALSIGYELYDDGGVYRLRESRVEWKDGA